MNHLTFLHQDGDLKFEIDRGTFLVTDDQLLTLSIHCKENPEHSSWMGKPSFCLVNIPLSPALAKGAVVRFAGLKREPKPGGRKPRSHVYHGEHNFPRDVEGIRKGEDKKRGGVHIFPRSSCTTPQTTTYTYDKLGRVDYILQATGVTTCGGWLG